MSTFALRRKHISIARLDRNKVEDKPNKAPWIAKLWKATDNPDLYDDPNPANRKYCAAGMAYSLREWLKLPDVLTALGKTAEQAEKWRCKSPGAQAWIEWANNHGILVLPKHCILHAADIVVYRASGFSHIELVTDDDSTQTGPFTAIGYNTNAAGSQDGEGCFEKPRSRKQVRGFIRILP